MQPADENARHRPFPASTTDHDGLVDGGDEFLRLPDDIVIVPMLAVFARALAKVASHQSACLTAELADQRGEWLISN